MGRKAARKQKSLPVETEDLERSVIPFYGESNEFGEFSNFYRHQAFEFELPAFAQRDGFPKTIWCEFSEKAIMAIKASLMNDLRSFKSIAEAEHPAAAKRLGRRVQNWNEELWQCHLEEVAYEVVRQKFDSSRSLREKLLSTGNATLVEAASNDRIWGAGLPKSDSRIDDPSQWQGRNILGFALMRARKNLRGDTAGASSNRPPVDISTKESMLKAAAASAAAVSMMTPPADGNASTNTTASSMPIMEEVVDQGLRSPEEVSQGRSRRWGASKARAKAKAQDSQESLEPEMAASAEKVGSRVAERVAHVGGYPEVAPAKELEPRAKSSDGYLPLLSPEQSASITVQMSDIERRLRPVLEEYGCAIVTGVATSDDCAQLEGSFAEDLKELIDIAALQKADKAVRSAAQAIEADIGQWPESSVELLGDLNRCQLRGLPHGRFAWGCRLLPQVRRCYEVIHQTTDLVSSCDNSFFAPKSQVERDTNRSWPHVDQNSCDQRFFDGEGVPVGDWEVYQGILYVWSSEDSRSSTTVVLPGSHRELYDQMMLDPSMKKRGQKGNHFSQLTSLSQRDLVTRLQEQWRAGAGRVPVPAGALFLWSSRTLHQGWTGGLRLSQPVCWEPEHRRDQATLERKMRLAALGLPSTHWASLGIPHTLVAPELSTATPASCLGRNIRFPMRPSLHPVSLREEVEVAEMWRRLRGYDFNGPLPAELQAFVEASLTDAIKAAL